MIEIISKLNIKQDPIYMLGMFNIYNHPKKPMKRGNKFRNLLCFGRVSKDFPSSLFAYFEQYHKLHIGWVVYWTFSEHIYLSYDTVELVYMKFLLEFYEMNISKKYLTSICSIDTAMICKLVWIISNVKGLKLWHGFYLNGKSFTRIEYSLWKCQFSLSILINLGEKEKQAYNFAITYLITGTLKIKLNVD